MKRLTSKSEEELRRITVELRRLEQTAEILQSRINVINAVTTDLTYANMTLAGLKKEEEKSELLVPVGGTSYIRAKLIDTDKVIVGIGGGVSTERTWQEAEDIITKRLESLRKTGSAIQHQFGEVAEKINQYRERFETLVATMRQGKAS
jgi:prefoldin alpha subunit